MTNDRKKRRIPWMTIVRRVIQLLSFILMPGLFISALSSIKSVYMAVIGGTFSFSALLPELLVILAVIPVTLLLGRFFCGFICSFGALGDLVWFVSRKIRKKAAPMPGKADRWLKLIKYAWLLFIVIAVWTLGAVSFDNNMNPWNIFGMYATISGWASMEGLLTVGGALLLLIVMGSFFVERFFCRYLCPLGAIFALVSRLRIFKVKKPTEGCKACRVCTRNCSMGIPIYQYDRVSSGECINCFECIRVCPRKNAQAAIAGKDAAPLAAGIAATAAILGLSYVGKITTNMAYAQAVVTEVSQSADSGSYTDGVYTGSAQGYRGKTKVQVTVENGFITDIEVVSTGDDSEFFNRAQNFVTTQIIAAQSADVDAVSGATYSSNAIKEAVADALDAAVVASAEPDTQAAAEETQSAPSASQEATQETISGIYTDGVYTGTGTGFRGETQVTVTVSGGSITDIKIESYEDDRPYFERASSLTEDIIAAQSVEVDAVSGATYSSNGILEAVADALGLDFTAETPQGGGHGGPDRH